MIDVRATINDRQIIGALNNLKFASGRNLRGTMTKIGRAMVTSTRLRFRSQVAPDGSRWLPSQRARREGGQTLRLTGRLQRSITYRAGLNDVAWGTNVEYARPLHFGVRKTVQVGAHRRRVTIVFGRRLREAITQNVSAHRRRMNLTARPILGANARDRVTILRIVRTDLAQAARP